MGSRERLRLFSAEATVSTALLERGVVPFLPLEKVEGLDAVVFVDERRLLRLRIVLSDIGSREVFRTGDVGVFADTFVVCVGLEECAENVCWVLPAAVFDAHAGRADDGMRVLEICGEGGVLPAVSEGVDAFVDLWELISEYDRFESLLSDGCAADVVRCVSAFRDARPLGADEGVVKG